MHLVVQINRAFIVASNNSTSNKSTAKQLLVPNYAFLVFMNVRLSYMNVHEWAPLKLVNFSPHLILETLENSFKSLALYCWKILLISKVSDNKSTIQKIFIVHLASSWLVHSKL